MVAYVLPHILVIGYRPGGLWIIRHWQRSRCPFPWEPKTALTLFPQIPIEHGYDVIAVNSFQVALLEDIYLHMPENKQRNPGHLSCKTASEQFNSVTISDDKRYLCAKCKTNAWPSNVTLISFQNLEDERYSVLCFETQYQLWMLYCSCQSSILTGCNSPAGLISDYTDSWPQPDRTGKKQFIHSALQQPQKWAIPQEKRKHKYPPIAWHVTVKMTNEIVNSSIVNWRDFLS